jgi:tetratricopeptide (TPR) repeat protein
MKYKLLLIIISLNLFSCVQDTEPKVYKKEIINDHFKNGKPAIDSLKELSIKKMLSGNWSEFKRLCEEVAMRDSNDADNLSRLASIYLIENNCADGLRILNKSIGLDSANHLPHNTTIKALLFYEMKNADSSNVYFKKMSSANSYNAIFMNDIVSLFYIFGKEEKGVEYIDLAYKYYPKDEMAIYNKALVLGGSENYEEAIKLLNSIKKKTKNPQVLFNLSVCYSNSGQFNKALTEINEAIRLSSGSIPAYFTDRGRTKQKLKDFIGAEKDFKEAMSKGDTSALRFYNSLLEEKKKK